MKSIIVNVDKHQYLVPAAFGDEPELEKFAIVSEGVLCGLTALLADGNGRGGGDLHSKDPLVGSWAGDRVVIACEDGKVGEHCMPGVSLSLYQWAMDTFLDISDAVVSVFICDSFAALKGIDISLPYSLRYAMHPGELYRFFITPVTEDTPSIKNIAAFLNALVPYATVETEHSALLVIAEALEVASLKAWGMRMPAISVSSYTTASLISIDDKVSDLLNLKVTSPEVSDVDIQLVFPLNAAELQASLEQIAPAYSREAKATLADAKAQHAAYVADQQERYTALMTGTALASFQNMLAKLVSTTELPREGV